MREVQSWALKVQKGLRESGGLFRSTPSVEQDWWKVFSAQHLGEDAESPVLGF